jgi:hypothetical protein
MPVIEATVKDVLERSVMLRNGKTATKFDVVLDRPVSGPGNVFETFDQFAASLCDRAKQTGKVIRLTYRDMPKWGAQITYAEIVERVA